MQKIMDQDITIGFEEKNKNIARPKDLIKEHRQPQWNPYVNNEGTICAIGGKGFLVIAGDTRLSNGFSIVSRNTSKISKLTKDVFLATSGMYADFSALCKNLQARLKMYEFDSGKAPSTKSCACLLSRTLYSKRFFPFYTFNALCGFDENGVGQTYGYDAVGSYDVKNYVVLGSASQMIVPIIDCQIEGYNKEKQTFNKDNKEEVIKLIIDVFNSASERDVYTGDALEIYVLEPGKEPVKQEVKLRQD
uniref:Proteasome subunit beta n=1 Tax=Philasterides dicentrarchi TaxID=282688 RepID=A0A411PX39_9CILI|nr:20S proteasome subunit beta 6 [Philasterides dicentrarchi]